MYLSDFLRWHKTFLPLLQQRTESHEEYAPPISLQLRFKAIYTCLTTDHFQDETSYDAHIADFEEVIKLATKLIAFESKHTPQYSFDGSLIVSVYVTAMKCRDKTIRRNAIGILRSRPMREGTMDSALRARLVELQMEIEEEGAVGSYIPEEARIRGIKTRCDMEERRGTMRYLVMVEKGRNVFQPRSVVFSW